MAQHFDIIQADYANLSHADAIIFLLDAYASDPMGGGKPLCDEVKKNIVKKLAEIHHAISVLGYVDNKPAGLINCFEGFSTFSCQPLLNIHDVFVLEEYRGTGLSIALLEKIEHIAKARGCCKLTLEVLSKNYIARAAYTKFGFSDYALDPETGKALFWQKLL